MSLVASRTHWRIVGLAIPSLTAVAFALLAPRPASSLPRVGEVPAFQLIDDRGQPASGDSLRGRVWVASFVFTRCAGQCPMITGEIARLAREFTGTPSIEFVTFTVDPKQDTPDVLTRYAAQYDVPKDRWRLLTGDEAEIQRLCRDGFHLAVDSQGGSPEEPIVHSLRLVLVDGTGQIRGYYDASEPDRLRQLRRDLRDLAARGGA